MDSMTDYISRYLSQLGGEVAEIAKRLDTTGWAIVSAALVICGWFFLKGTGIKST